MRPFNSVTNSAQQWVRAEILGAFFNAVFLIALCVSIILEAVTRLIEPPEISNPKLILIVGCAGLFSNLLGFVVLGGHGHDHGHDHEHDHENAVAGQDHSHSHDIEQGRNSLSGDAADEDSTVVGVLPETVVSKFAAGKRSSTDSPETARRIRWGDEADSRTTSQSRGRDRRRSSKAGHSRFTSIDDMSIYPSSFRQDIIAAANQTAPPPESDTSEDSPVADSETETNEQSPLLRSGNKGGHGTTDATPSPHQHSKRRPRRDSSVHDGHHHTQPQKAAKSSTGHNHADMGMNAMMLHVLGDALGNVGVIITALIIWLTDWPGKLYSDPAVSLFITLIILKTSIPLTRATSRILLQATPENISVPEIRQDIERLPGVVSCHHVHVWQLSDTKVVASLHLQVAFPINTHSGEKYMQLAKRARKCLHGFGIHSATIQPEFCLDSGHEHANDGAALTLDGAADANHANSCLLECVEDCEAQGCCSTADVSSKASSIRRPSNSSLNGASPHQH
jgi:zinc transporter 1